MKFYLAHPILKRHIVRRLELKFERETGIELVNPFYDTCEREDVKKIDKGEMKLWDEQLDFEGIVQKDLKAIDSTDGIIAFIYKTFSIGTYMELWYAYSKGKKIYAVTRQYTHPWIRYVCKNGKIFRTFKELLNYFKKENRNS